MIPSATYRLQFRNGVTFDTAIDLIPHLQNLGISHLYASPIFAAVEGSTHGYDVVDPNVIDPAIGGREGFERMSSRLKEAGLDLILDIVPNHMAASVENAWWRDVLRHGEHSLYARHFDIDWSNKLTLPVLGKDLGPAIAANEVRLVRDPRDRSLAVAYFETMFPISDETAAMVSAMVNRDDSKLDEISSRPEKMQALLAAQHWMLMNYKEAASNLSYRRFFEVAGLVGMKVEDERVFQDTHRLILDLVEAGRVQGLRIDHVDGLADPTGYLDTLRDAVGPQTYITVEKILGPSEWLPTSWPVSGTTGYEFISALSDLYIDDDGVKTLQNAYAAIAPERADFQRELRKAKREMVERNFAGEVDRLVNLASATGTGIDPAALLEAIREMLIAFPVYRTYGFEGILPAEDSQVLHKVVDDARRMTRHGNGVDLIEKIVLGELKGDAAFEFRVRFQQLSGPIMAKALEDTLFYRFNRLIAANEVGGEPEKAPGGVSAFHSKMTIRSKTQATALSATATHDTKRGEDARARLYTLSEAPSRWIEGVSRWREMNRSALATLPDGSAPESNIEWMLYQALAGVWMEGGADGQPTNLRERFVGYVEKAVREAKLRTEWAGPNENYEKAVLAYADRLVSPENKVFLDDFSRTIGPFIDAGFINSLSQTLIKLTAPGVPDIYQGTEGLDFSLVDPDNRRPVDFAALAALAANDGDKLDAETKRIDIRHQKAQLIRKVVNFRRQNAELFNLGIYLPIEAFGRRRENLMAFARILDGKLAITAAPRMVYGHVLPQTLQIPQEFWEDTVLRIPALFRSPVQDILSNRVWTADEIPLWEIFKECPVGLIINKSDKWDT
ncbi:malto-oligosyltrehalose synthase [Rhizobium sp. Root483D2]|uniref:malto-oligosyltrehalose synthase n=1 Tax=Rhizobium sp. Root483D2 TaxID=1736545 RepID=UPI0007156379|nr:malto-oligosyltrehalose synthase [Rhizobium sp. Root483D2]KQY41452.1 malto-oligosyltrehalose synthase [Rhizobium sp. Root483D2]